MIATVFRASCVAAVLCFCAAAPAFALTGNLSAVTYVDETLQNRIYVFAISNSGRLVGRKFDGTNWSAWIDHGLPAGAQSLQTVDAITYSDASGNRRIYVFTLDNNRRLKLRYLDGVIWRWVDQSGPQMSMSDQAAITYIDPAGNRRIYYFTDSSGLQYNYWNGSSWQWVHPGYPTDIPGGLLLGADAITYIDEQGNRRIEVFCVFMFDNQTDLYSYSWNGTSWNWINLQGTDNNKVSAVTYSEASGTRRIRAFTRGSEEILRMRSWNGSSEGTGNWSLLSKPDGVPDSNFQGQDVIAYTENGDRRMRVFGQFDNRIYSRLWDGSSWLGWFSHGLPPGGTASNPTVVTYYAAFPESTRYIHMFVKCADRQKLCDQVYDGTSWKWQDLGAP